MSPTFGGCSVLDIFYVKDAEGGLAPLAEVRSDIPSIIRYLCHGALRTLLLNMVKVKTRALGGDF